MEENQISPVLLVVTVFVNRDKYNYLEPDLIILCPHNENDDRNQMDGCHGAPDFVLEIVSPSSVKMDYVKKLDKYADAGVREYWIVDPLKERVFVYNFEKKSQHLPKIKTGDHHESFCQ